jgi:NADH:ubiquinone oxidoreductase subunit H
MNLSAAVVKRSSSLVSLLQPIADGVKLLMKGIILPTNANKALYLLAPRRAAAGTPLALNLGVSSATATRAKARLRR